MGQLGIQHADGRGGRGEGARREKTSPTGKLPRIPPRYREDFDLMQDLGMNCLPAFLGKKMIDCFGDRVKYWLTFNEQNIFHMPGFRISGS
ncbi:glycoside hydrolase, family 1 domain protein [Enterobacter hormaechei subsp. xiangfangensis]|nr:glycoside hydrolase, family 1 domain protein [Enterobacter hormaechei subsp. xiangfangensis]